MNIIIFNFHDVLLVLTAFECLLFAMLLWVTNKEQALSTIFLVGFLLCHFLIPLNELTFWGNQFRFWLLETSPNLFFIGSYAYFLDGPLLYFFVRSLLFKDFILRGWYWGHLLPVLLYLTGMTMIFYTKDFSVRHHLVETQHIVYSSPYLYFEAVGRYLRLIYALFSFVLVLNYSQHLKHHYANLKSSDVTWLKIMLSCFNVLFAWDCVLLTIKLIQLEKSNFDLDLLNVVGLSGYYLNFVVINILIFLKFTNFSAVAKVDEKPALKLKHEQLYLADPNTISTIEKAMKEKKYYADPDITLDNLAKALRLTPKKLSLTIKLHYHLNFYEFINSYRIEEAKHILIDPQAKHKTITDIYFEVGFNSKSVFYSFFKRMVGVTPSQYREKIKD